MNQVGRRNEANRVDWVAKTLGHLPEGIRLLDAGAGEQPYRKFCERLDYVAQDSAEYDAAAVATGLQMERWDYGRLRHRCDITEIPEPDASFDAVLCTEVFEHLPDPLAAMREFARLLRPGGELILTAPFSSLTHFAPQHFATGFNRYFYETHLARLGFEVIEISPNGNYFEWVAQELRRVRPTARRYADRRGTWLERLATRYLLRRLNKYSAAGDTSAELACFGLHVRARRLNTPHVAAA